MNMAKTSDLVLLMLDILLSLATMSEHAKRAAEKLKALFATAEAEGRDLTREEILALREDADVADAIWEAALKRAKERPA